jgi:hypothetical protein
MRDANEKHKYCLQIEVNQGKAFLLDKCLQCGQTREIDMDPMTIPDDYIEQQQARYGKTAWNKRAGYYVGELDCEHQAHLRAEPRSRTLTFCGQTEEYVMISAACVKFIEGGNESYYMALFRCANSNTFILPIGLNRQDAEYLIQEDSRTHIVSEGFAKRMWSKILRKPHLMYTSSKVTIKLANQMPVTLSVRMKTNIRSSMLRTEVSTSHVFIHWDDCMTYMVTPIAF